MSSRRLVVLAVKTIHHIVPPVGRFAVPETQAMTPDQPRRRSRSGSSSRFIPERNI